MQNLLTIVFSRGLCEFSLATVLLAGDFYTISAIYIRYIELETGTEELLSYSFLVVAGLKVVEVS